MELVPLVQTTVAIRANLYLVVVLTSYCITTALSFRCRRLLVTQQSSLVTLLHLVCRRNPESELNFMMVFLGFPTMMIGHPVCGRRELIYV